MSFHMPVRGGSRGGKDQFEWEDVKADKYRENYLGQFRRLNWTIEVVGRSVSSKPTGYMCKGWSLPQPPI